MVSMIRIANFHFPEVEKIDFPGVNCLEAEAMDFHVEAMEKVHFEGKLESSDMVILCS
jgi:hypothetical protein